MPSSISNSPILSGISPKIQRQRPVIGITIGDPAGIGPEVVAKALRRSNFICEVPLRIIGDREVVSRYMKKLPKDCAILPADFIGQKRIPRISPGKPSPQTGRMALSYLKTAIHLLKKGDIQGLVTAPVSKEFITAGGVPFQGHTEMLAKAFHIARYDMMFVSPHMRTVVVTRHIPLKQVSRCLTQKAVLSSIELAHHSLEKLFCLSRPRIAVCGLNPHAGEGGIMGQEEERVIIPAIQQARKHKIRVQGPFPADTLFSPRVAGSFDVIIAMYHDQGLIPIKALYFTQLVNLTIGLPFIRTSPAHGTAFDIAGRNKADPSSMIEAIKLAIQLTSQEIGQRQRGGPSPYAYTSIPVLSRGE
jgi:4-hydroxythreonine-4-phosphate dehydrogenase